jgi:hypothetical protein
VVIVKYRAIQSYQSKTTLRISGRSIDHHLAEHVRVCLALDKKNSLYRKCIR